MVSDRKKFDADIGLSDSAIDWVVKLSSGRATTEEHLQFSLWRQQSEKHELAALEAESLWHGIGATGNRMRKAERDIKFTRRAMLGVAMAGATGIAFERVGIIGPQLYADYATRTAEQRTVRLDDGSTVIMNGNTAFSSELTKQERRLSLYQGQALFQVAKDGARPFIVEADGGETRALGTEFDIDIRSEKVVVTVTEGIVSVSSGATETAFDGRSVRAVANQRVSYQSDRKPSIPQDIDADLETAWLRGKLIFNARPLGEVVATLSRYRSGKIIIANSQLRSLEVTGVFDLTQPETVLETVEKTLPVSVTRMPFVTILR
ncbi:FecR family protein [Brucella thiophenivorans]|uniref:FecR family protein n=1 Tax=Brucella thiophenivorans TaxID=571255 RepID=UPI000B993537|nr:FecR family protein [Brucella thiophenivorans]